MRRTLPSVAAGERVVPGRSGGAHRARPGEVCGTSNRRKQTDMTVRANVIAEQWPDERADPTCSTRLDAGVELQAAARRCLGGRNVGLHGTVAATGRPYSSAWVRTTASSSAMLATSDQLATRTHTANHRDQAVNVWQRPERRANDADDQVRAVDQVPLAILQMRAKIRDQQLITRLARAVEEVVQVIGLKQAPVGLRRRLRAKGRWVGRRQGDVDSSPRRDREFVDRRGRPPAHGACGHGLNVRFDAQAESHRARRDTTGIQQQDTKRAHVAVEGSIAACDAA